MYDVVIIGCGPAGITAAIYLKRANKKVLVLEKETIGGSMASSPLIENYPGYDAISGSKLAGNMYNQLEKLDIPVEIENVLEIKDGENKQVITEDNCYYTKSIIVATGSKYRLLNLPNEKELIGNGIHFCVSCDGAFYKNKIVAVIGGGNSAIINALALADICQKVYIIQNLQTLTAEGVLQEKILSKDNVEAIYNATVKEIIGEDKLESIVIETSGKKKKILLDGMFISIGLIPLSDNFKGLLTLDKYNYILSNDCNTNVSGIFVAGDVRTKTYRQITTAESDGTIAANLAISYLNEKN